MLLFFESLSIYSRSSKLPILFLIRGSFNCAHAHQVIWSNTNCTMLLRRQLLALRWPNYSLLTFSLYVHFLCISKLKSTQDRPGRPVDDTLRQPDLGERGSYEPSLYGRSPRPTNVHRQLRPWDSLCICISNNFAQPEKHDLFVLVPGLLCALRPQPAPRMQNQDNAYAHPANEAVFIERVQNIALKRCKECIIDSNQYIPIVTCRSWFVFSIKRNSFAATNKINWKISLTVSTLKQRKNRSSSIEIYFWICRHSQPLKAKLSLIGSSSCSCLLYKWQASNTNIGQVSPKFQVLSLCSATKDSRIPYLHFLK